MKFTVAGLVLAVALASPALGQNKTKKERNKIETQSWQTWPAWQSGQTWHSGQARQQTWQSGRVQEKRKAHSPNPEWDVYRTSGEYAGSDPDPRVRMYLRTDIQNTD
jgi:hypothetical protein